MRYASNVAAQLEVHWAEIQDTKVNNAFNESSELNFDASAVSKTLNDSDKMSKVNVDLAGRVTSAMNGEKIVFSPNNNGTECEENPCLRLSWGQESL